MTEMHRRSLSDGSLDFGYGIVGPSFSGQEYFNSQTKKPLSARKDSIADSFVRILPPSLVTALLISACNGSNSNPTQLEGTIAAEQYQLPFDGTWYLTGGPHKFSLPNGAPTGGVIASDLDFAPKPVVSCSSGQEVVLKDWNITASKSGIVTIVGDEKNKRDPNHSIIQIKHVDGKSTRYIHSANIQVKVGDAVGQNQVIAHPSCEVPPSGYTTGLHLDFSVIGANGNPQDIRGLTFSNWKADSSSKNYQGTMSKSGEKTRTADVRRCDTTTACGGILNNISNGPAKSVLGAATTPTPTPRPTPTFTPRPTETPRPTATSIPRPTETIRPTPTIENKAPIGDTNYDIEKAQAFTSQYLRQNLKTDIGPLSLAFGLGPGVAFHFKTNGVGSTTYLGYQQDGNISDLSIFIDGSDVIKETELTPQLANSIISSYFVISNSSINTCQTQYSRISCEFSIETLEGKKGFGVSFMTKGGNHYKTIFSCFVPRESEFFQKQQSCLS